MLEDRSDLEELILSKIPYQENEAILHTDKSIFAKKKSLLGLPGIIISSGTNKARLL